MTGDNPEEAKALLKMLALQYPEEFPHAIEALGYCRGMRAALIEDRWFGPEPGDHKKRRSERLCQYRRYRELFEIEVEATRHQRNSIMVLSKDWSRLRTHLSSALRLTGSRWMLRLAGRLCQAGLPGALDVCDAAASELFRAAYLQE